MATINPVTIEAKYYTRDGDEYICGLCPHRCRITKGGFGRCGSRRGEEDILSAYTYGRVSFICNDPIEKKPLYHFRPRTKIFSIGGVGCNMTCRHCQNYAISQSASGKKRTTYKTPADIIEMCRKEGADAIAFTYNEPGIWLEYILDIKKLAPDMKFVIVSNGMINDEPLKDLCAVADAFNIDVKGFDEEFYSNVCGGHLEDVLRSVKTVYDQGVHLELTYLIIPEYNDSETELNGFAQWVKDNLSVDVPVHFTRFHPDNEMEDVPWTPEDTLLRARDIAMGIGLNYVYIGNILSENGSDTLCPKCGSPVITRIGYLVNPDGLDGSKCKNCGYNLNIIR